MTPLKTLLLAPLALFPLLTSAATPSFDCHKASGAVETLICKDAKLTALDNELADLYHKALAQLSPEQRKMEQATQRGWIKGRNECWKGQDLRQCVEDNYKLRIAELQVTGGQLMVTAPVFYRCGDQLMLETYFYQDAKVPVAVLNLSEGNRPPLQTIAYQEPSASGARYEGQNISLFTKGDEARLERFGQPAFACKVSTAQGK